MNFREIAENRQSCRSYNPSREVEEEKLSRILKTARLSPPLPATVSHIK